LSRRYGALLNVEEELRKRKNVADRQAQVSLGEQIGWVQGIGQAAKGAYRIYHGDVFGAGDIAAGMAMKRLASELKELNTTNSMIKRAFENYKGRPTPVTVQPFQPRGLLGPGPLVTPPPADPSFVRGVPGMYPAGPDPRRALTPSDTLITPPPADASGIQIVDAARGIARDPKTGRMFRYYTSGRAPNLESPEPLR
jgi:hypothetical protein